MLTDTDKIVAATLAAAKASKENIDSRLQWVLEYERMLKVLERRNEQSRPASAEKSADPVE